MPVGMAMALLLLPFLPASGVLLRVGFVIAERYMILLFSHQRLLSKLVYSLLQSSIHAQSWILSTGGSRDEETGSSLSKGEIIRT